MTLKLSLPPELERRLRAAASQKGERVDQFVVQLLDENLPPTDTKRAAANLLLDWAKEVEAMTDAESAENERILRAIDSDRLSDRKLFSHLFKGKSP
ncbi:MAG TPA: hypothetical protein VKD90_05080 [Gemmataceae bacterium]|nr:hypothetical protein [Gemmataceae bacterium]